MSLWLHASQQVREFPASVMLDNLNEVAATIFKYCRGNGPHDCRRLRKGYTEPSETIVFGENIIYSEHRARNAVGNQR